MGESTIEDWNLFLKRQPEEFNLECLNVMKLSFSNQTVAEHNTNMSDSLGLPIAEIKSKINPRTASKLSSEQFGGLENQIYLAKGAKVMLSRNLWSDVGLCNGSLCTVKDIIFQDNQLPPSLPIAIVVKFDKYTGPSFCEDDEKCVPIVPIASTSLEQGINHERIQIPYFFRTRY